MKNIQFVLEGETLINLVNNTELSNNDVKNMIRTFIDLGWIITDKGSVGSIELVDRNTPFLVLPNDSVKIVCQYTEEDGSINSYELYEDNVLSYLGESEIVKDSENKVSFMSNLSNG